MYSQDEDHWFCPPHSRHEIEGAGTEPCSLDLDHFIFSSIEQSDQYFRGVVVVCFIDLKNLYLPICYSIHLMLHSFLGVLRVQQWRQVDVIEKYCCVMIDSVDCYWYGLVSTYYCFLSWAIKKTPGASWFNLKKKFRFQLQNEKTFVVLFPLQMGQSLSVEKCCPKFYSKKLHLKIFMGAGELARGWEHSPSSRITELAFWHPRWWQLMTTEISKSCALFWPLGGSYTHNSKSFA